MDPGTQLLGYLLVIVIVAIIIRLLKYIRTSIREKPNAILMVGIPGSGKTLLSHGIMTYLQSTETRKYQDNIDSQNRVLRQEISDLILTDKWPTRSNDATANRISFTMGAKSFEIYDFSGESIEAQNEISRGEVTRKFNYLEHMEISTGVTSGKNEIKLNRGELKHIIYLIPAVLGKYQAKSFLSAERMLKWIRELTIRVGGKLEDHYSQSVLSQKNTAHNIKIHAIFTKFSEIENSEISNDELKESLLSLCPELYSLVEATNGSVIAVNVYSQDDETDEIKQDWVGLEELTQTLNMN